MVTKLIERLPDSLHPRSGDEIPRGLIGATIISIGRLAGDFAIDYLEKSGVRKRVVLGFDEVRLWVQSDLEL